MEQKNTPGEWKVMHSESKNAFNVIGTVLGGNYKIARCPYPVYDFEGAEKRNKSEKEEAEANARLIAASPTLLKEMQRYLPVLQWVENIPEIWDSATKGTGIATLNGFKAAIDKAKDPQSDADAECDASKAK